VVRTGHVDRSELVALERAAAAVVLPSLAEGFGLPVLESLAAGAVVVTTGDTACGEVAGDAALRVPAGDADALAAAIARVLDDPTLAAGLRAAGPLRAGSFTWSAAADGVRAAYRDVLSGSNAGGRR
jgi:glycosyltransferase involved in cell wall biosynthesis